MKVRTRAADGVQPADCGHLVANGHAFVRRGKRWVCTGCSLPDGTLWNPAKCAACKTPMGPGARVALRADGWWCHYECFPGRPLALATVTDGHQSGFL